MRPVLQLIAVGLLCCGCQGTGPAKYDNPVVGPPPPRLPMEQIQRKKLAAEELRQSRETQLAENSTAVQSAVNQQAADREDDLLQEGERPIKQASAKRTTTQVGQTPDEEGPAYSSGIEQVKMPSSEKDPFPKFEDGTIVATVNGQPIFAGEILAPAINALTNKESELKKQFGKNYKPEMMDQIRVILLYQSLPRAIERKMLVHAAKTGLKKQQLEGMKKAIATEWTEHLQQMMDANKVASVSELEEMFKKNNFNLEEHKASFEDEHSAKMYIGSQAHSKYQPSRMDMIAYYRDHKE
ncbi:MAG: PpiC-type peptidyl-prolyl cis-trans isomerase, partial [Planctomycetaceae bacterium]|nr:PpiC-type peptidyl-prolyl cis-trans isomerase [Planctomycetaceae bacterium]